MSVITPEIERILRQVFKRFNPFMIWMWRMGLGRWINIWPEGFGRIMVIIHTGRKSGLRRLTPVNYAVVNGDIYCTAGFGSISDWYRNLLVNPQVEIWLPDSRWVCLAEDISGDKNRLSLMRQVIIGSGFVGKIVGLDPDRMDDHALDQATSDYRLLRIRQIHRQSGPDGPGDLTWLWLPIAAVGLLLYVRKNRK